MMWHVTLVILAAFLWPSFGYRSRVRRASDYDIQLGDGPNYIEEGFYGDEETYNDNSDFTWKVHVPDQGYAILLKSLNFQLEGSYDCRYDFVEIFDGEKTAGNSVGKFCGYQDVQLISHHRQIFVHFKSDSSVTASGFHFELRRVPAASSGACNRTISSATGTLTSVGYGDGRYPANTSCLYSIKGSTNNRINLTFDEFWLERGDCLFGDYLTVYDGRSSAVEIGRYCGKAAPLYILSSSSEMLLYFHSNGLFITEKGFKLTYRQLAKGGATTYEVVDREKIPEDDSDCSGDITTLGRNLTSPKLEGDPFYPGKKECKTVIEAPPGKQVILHFVNFHLEDSSECIYDHVNVTYKLKGDASFTVRLCGYHRYNSLCFRSADNRITLDFRSDLMFEREGYMATYEFLSANDTKDCPPLMRSGRCGGYWYDNGNGLACACTTETVPPECTQSITWTNTLRENLTTYEDITHSFSCGVNHPHPLVTWDYEFSTLPDSTKSHISVFRNGTLNLSKVSKVDSGVYTCTVQAGTWISTQSVNLTVKHEVEFCGRASESLIDPNTNLGSAKVAGKNASKVPDTIPWQVLLWNDKLEQHHCGGVLISELFVLTAGHCIRGDKAKVNYTDLVVSLGTKGCKNEGTEKRNIARYILHPKYDSITLEYDLALLELDRPVTTKSNEIYPICLSSSAKLWNAVTPGTMGRIAGCGKDSKGLLPDVMHTVTVPLLSRKECEDSKQTTFTEDMFCGGYKGAPLGDACEGDSGGAIAVKFENRWTLLGLISFGEGCAEDGQYGFYSNVSMAKDWIAEYAGPCGRSRVKDIQGNVDDSRIYHGDDARPGQFPWATRMVLARRSSDGVCGATFINSNWLISARHCVCLNPDQSCTQWVKTGKKKKLQRVTIEAGTVTTDQAEATRKTLKIVEVERHPKEDLVLVKLSEPVKFNDHIQPACLPRGGVNLEDGKKGTVAGWGHGQEGKRKVANRLQFAEFVKKDEAFCEKDWTGHDFSTKSCFLGVDMAKAFAGDSGAGLVWEQSDVFTLDGIYIRGSRRATNNQTGIFVDVSKYLPWILEKIGWKS